MAVDRSQKQVEALELLKEVQSWSEGAVERLPKLYREKAKEYRRESKSGEA